MNTVCKLFGTGLFVLQFYHSSTILAQDNIRENDTSTSTPAAALRSAYGTLNENDDSVTNVSLGVGQKREVVGNVMYHVTGITYQGRTKLLAAGQSIPDMINEKDMSPIAINSAPLQPYNPEKIPGSPQQP